jgi:tetratricopeptide (TPR) repeat protein
MGFCPQCGFEKADDAVFCSKCGIRFQNKSFEGYEAGLAAFKSGGYAEAVTTLSAYLKENPDNADAWNALGVAFFKIGNTQNAVKCVKKALNLNPDNAKYQKNFGLITKGHSRSKYPKKSTPRYKIIDYLMAMALCVSQT